MVDEVRSKDYIERRKRVLKELRALADSDDPEAAHTEADSLLLQLIDDPMISKAYDSIEKWCA